MKHSLQYMDAQLAKAKEALDRATDAESIGKAIADIKFYQQALLMAEEDGR